MTITITMQDNCHLCFRLNSSSDVLGTQEFNLLKDWLERNNVRFTQQKEDISKIVVNLSEASVGGQFRYQDIKTFLSTDRYRTGESPYQWDLIQVTFDNGIQVSVSSESLLSQYFMARSEIWSKVKEIFKRQFLIKMIAEGFSFFPSNSEFASMALQSYFYAKQAVEKPQAIQCYFFPVIPRLTEKQQGIFNAISVSDICFQLEDYTMRATRLSETDKKQKKIALGKTIRAKLIHARDEMTQAPMLAYR
ncbi:MAG: hypothetical protein A2X77_05355 [Gammaproteobacteria bacterium GWE2_42_36]|nr:MAG: hypothetical protein A2X77_05355 [Gammaproteobacteria bacterium GWE2_42_36]HCU05480.1 hypothetical protein [Coxiellaceae bacterium]